MNNDYPLLHLVDPTRHTRRLEGARVFPTDAAVIAARQEIARRARAALQPVSDRLRRLTAEERRAIFYKIEHDGPLSLSGTGLKPIADAGGIFTLAIPTADTSDLGRYLTKVDKFETGAINRGMVPAAAEVAHLLTIAEGKPLDRVSSELAEDYDDLIQRDSVFAELELTSYARGAKQRREELRKFLARLRGEFTNQRGVVLEHEEDDGTMRVVIRCDGATLQRLVEAPEWQLDISWFEARPAFQTFKESQELFAIDQLGTFVPPDATAPVVCVIDTGISPGNPFLAPVTRADLLRSFIPGKSSPADEYGHGNGVGSLVAYYAINVANGAENRGRAWIAGARILDENNDLNERLFSAAIREAVEYFVPRGVRIFNLSVNVRNRSWAEDQKRTVPRNSWIARSVDKISKEYDVLFVISTGNLTLQEVNWYGRENKAYPQYLSDDGAALLDPAQAALALTVGSVSSTTLIAGDANGQALVPRGAPAPWTRIGPGICKEPKPELLEADGNLAFDADLQRARLLASLQIATASNSITPALTWDHGTSLAAARVSNKVARVVQDLAVMGVPQPSAPLIKAVLINSALPVDEGNAQVRELFDGWEGAVQAKARCLGHGIADAERATTCDDYQAVMYYEGSMDADAIVYFQIPVPANLAVSGNSTKRLTVTLCFYPEVQRWGLEDYLGSQLKWRMFRGDVQQEAIIAAMSSEEDDGDAEAERPNELRFDPGIRSRSRGTTQHAIFEWTQHRAEFADNHYTLAVAAYKRWQRKQAKIGYAVVVRLEELGRTAEIYAQVEQSLHELQIQT